MSLTKDVCKAAKEQQLFNRSGSQVSVKGSEVLIYLHKHCIAKLRSGCILTVSDAGVRTRTTQVRINGLLTFFGTGLTIRTKGGNWWYYRGKLRCRVKHNEFESVGRIISRLR